LSKILEKPRVFNIMRQCVIFLLTVICWGNYASAQQQYNSCVNALELCPNTLFSVDNIQANVTFCAGCDDDFNFCFTTDNTIWFTFTTNAAGGDVQVDLSNLVFEANPGQDNELQATIIEAPTPCSSASYTQIGNCVSNATANFTLNALALPPNTLYYIVIDGDNNGAGITSAAECTFDLLISGPGIDRPIPSATITPDTTNICLNDVVYFAVGTQDCPDNGDYSWYINGSLVAVTTLNEFQTSGINDGDVVTVETSCYTQCPEIVSVDSPAFSVYSFSVYAGEDQTILPGEAITLNGITTAPVHVWSPAYMISDPAASSTIATPDQTVTITFSATENGCTLSDYILITVTETLGIPNTFSPNGDNVNDTWIIEGIEIYPNCSMKIFDRWGQEVYQTTGYSSTKAWDGKMRNRKPTEGVYFYILELRDEGKQLFKGTITLIK
jgi:gliding motility-associated-like protein